MIGKLKCPQKYPLLQYVKPLYVEHVFYLCSHASRDIQELCQSTLQDFNLCMFYQPGNLSNSLNNSTDLRPHEEKAVHLEDDMVFKMVVICMASIHLLQSAGKCLVSGGKCLVSGGGHLHGFYTPTAECW